MKKTTKKQQRHPKELGVVGCLTPNKGALRHPSRPSKQLSKVHIGACCNGRSAKPPLASPKATLTITKSVKSPKQSLTPEYYRQTKPFPSENVRRSQRTPPRVNFNFDIKNVNFFKSTGSKKKNRRKTTEAHSKSPASDKKSTKNKEKQQRHSKIVEKTSTHRKCRSQQVIPVQPPLRTLNTEQEDECTVAKYALRSKPGRCQEDKPKVNQDAVVCMPNFLNSHTSLFGVCDGHGLNGHFVSEFIKEILPDNLEYFCIKSKMARQRKTPKEVASILALAYKKTSEDLQGSGNDRSTVEIDISFSGSTAVMVFIDRSRLFCANIGDSRAVLFRQDKHDMWSYKQLSTDHTPDVQKEAARILKHKGRLQPYRDDDGQQIGPCRIWLPHDQLPGLAMTRSFGDSVATSVGVTSEPEVMAHEISTDDKFMIIASDGLWEFITCEQALAIVVPCFLRNDPEEGAKQLERAALHRWNLQDSIVDDISIVVTFFRNY